ncbi:hypothetical protein HDU76_003611 [Blyttiomyces sp. JEL0837]|nr:hypothetical protein HDU76_003611 [Blyttiomyces sp. JEL0837]
MTTPRALIHHDDRIIEEALREAGVGDLTLPPTPANQSLPNDHLFNTPPAVPEFIKKRKMPTPELLDAVREKLFQFCDENQIEHSFGGSAGIDYDHGANVFLATSSFASGSGGVSRNGQRGDNSNRSEDTGRISISQLCSTDDDVTRPVGIMRDLPQPRMHGQVTTPVARPFSSNNDSKVDKQTFKRKKYGYGAVASKSKLDSVNPAEIMAFPTSAGVSLIEVTGVIVDVLRSTSHPSLKQFILMDPNVSNMNSLMQQFTHFEDVDDESTLTNQQHKAVMVVDYWEMDNAIRHRGLNIGGNVNDMVDAAIYQTTTYRLVGMLKRDDEPVDRREARSKEVERVMNSFGGFNKHQHQVDGVVPRTVSTGSTHGSTHVARNVSKVPIADRSPFFDNQTVMGSFSVGITTRVVFQCFKPPEEYLEFKMSRHHDDMGQSGFSWKTYREARRESRQILRSSAPTAVKLTLPRSPPSTSTSNESDEEGTKFRPVLTIDEPVSLRARKANCLFCEKVLNDLFESEGGEIVARSPTFTSFKDFKPASALHVLAVPNIHIQSVLEVTPEDLPLLYKLREHIHFLLDHCGTPTLADARNSCLTEDIRLTESYPTMDMPTNLQSNESGDEISHVPPTFVVRANAKLKRGFHLHGWRRVREWEKELEYDLNRSSNGTNPKRFISLKDIYIFTGLVGHYGWVDIDQLIITLENAKAEGETGTWDRTWLVKYKR